MTTAEQKIREFAADILNWADPHNSKHQQNLDGAVEIYKKHFGQPEQSCKPDCKMCSGEYCATHYAQPCDCDVIDRHKELDVYPLHGCFTGDCPHSNANECVASLKSYVAELERQVYPYDAKPQQPDESLDEIVEKCCMNLTVYNYLPPDITAVEATNFIRQACLEFAATKEKNAQKLCNNLAGVLNAADGDDLIAIVETIIKQRDDAMANQDPHYYFKVHEVGRPLPIDTEILLDDGRWVEACSWPQYDSTINYQARVKKGAK